MANNKNFVVKNGLTVGTDATIGSTLYVSTVDTTDSSAITVVPSTTFNSDVTVENDLRVTNAIENTSGNTLLPAVLGNADQVLTVSADGNNADWKSISDIFGGGIDNVVDDTTPQLGGNLDLNSQNITGTGNIDVTGNVTASGSLFVPIIDTSDSSAITVVPAATFNSDVTVENDLVANGNVTASAFFGDGSNLTGISTTTTFVDLTDTDVASQASNTLVKYNGANYVATSTSEDSSGNVTITGQLNVSTIDTTDSSAISVTPAAIFNSDVTVENDLIVTNKVTAVEFIGDGRQLTNINANNITSGEIPLGTRTSGNYVAAIAGTTNEVEVTGSGSETAAVTIGLPDDVTISNELTVTTGLFTPLIDTTDSSTLTITPATTFSSDVTVENDLNVDNDVIIGGNLTVQGNTTQVDSNVVNIGDNIITLNSDETGTPSQNAGIEVERGTSDIVALRWNESTDKWEITSDGTTYNAISTVNSAVTSLTGTANEVEVDVSTGDITIGLPNDVTIGNELTVTTGLFTPLIDTTDSSAITVVPAATFNSDVTVENNLYSTAALINNLGVSDALYVDFIRPRPETGNNLSISGEVSFSGTVNANLFDTDDSSAIVFTPAVEFESDVSVQNNLIVTNQVDAARFKGDGSLLNNLQVSLVSLTDTNVGGQGSNTLLKYDGDKYVPTSLTENSSGDVTANSKVKINYSSTTEPALAIESTDGTSNASPELELYKNSTSADGHYLGQIKFAGENDTGGKVNYAKITGKILDNTNGTEDGILEFAFQKAGSQNIAARFRSDSLQLINGTNLVVNGTATFDDTVTVNSNIVVTGTVDSRDIATDGTKLDTIESNATADQTAAEILAALITVDGAGTSLDADLLDGQQGSYYLDGANFTGTLPNNYVTLGTMTAGNYMINVSGTANEIEIAHTQAEGSTATIGLPNNVTIGNELTVTTALFTPIIDTTDSSGITVVPSTTFNSDVNIQNDLRVTNSIENASGSTLLPATLGTTNQVLTVNAAGNAAWSTISTGALNNVVEDTTPQLGGDLDLNSQDITGTGNINITGNIAVSGTVDGRDVAADGTKLDGIESGATADQTASEILTAIKTVDGTGSGLDADTVDGIEAAAITQSGDSVALTGDVTGSTTVSATGEISIATTIAANSITLGTDTAGDYVATVTGTANEVEVTGSGGETAAVTVGLPSDVTVSNNLTVGGYLAGPASFTIDPAGVGDNTGTVIIAGDLQVDGTTTTINSTTVTVDDLNLTLASGAASAAAANGAGITVDGANATITYDSTNDEWDFNKNVNITGNLILSGTVDGRDIATDGAKLDTIESNATADQTAAEILTAIKTVDGATSGLDADLLDGQEGSYYLDGANFTGTLPNNYVTLGTMTTGNYMVNVTGTTNEIEITHTQAEGSTATIGLPDDVTIGNELTVTTALFTPIIDTTDSSAITITPAAVFSSDVTIENDLRVRNDIENSSGETILPSTLGSAAQVLAVNSAGNGVEWIASNSTNSARTEEHPTVTNGAATVTMGSAYTLNQIDVYLNGARMKSGTDYSVSSTTLTFSENLSTGDVVAIYAYDTAESLITGNWSDLNDVSVTGASANAMIRYTGGNWAVGQSTEDSSGNITVAGNVTATGTVSAATVTATGSLFTPIIDTTDSSAITITPAAVFSSDVTVENDLTVTNDVTATIYYGDGSQLTGISAGATGGSTDQVFYENDQVVTTNYTISTNKNAMTAGPITVNSGVTITIPTGSEWSIV